MSFLLCFNYKKNFFPDTQVCKHDLVSKSKILPTQNSKFHLNLDSSFFFFSILVRNVVFPKGRGDWKALSFLSLTSDLVMLRGMTGLGCTFLGQVRVSLRSYAESPMSANLQSSISLSVLLSVTTTLCCPFD